MGNCLMKEKIVTAILNIFKIKSIVTLVTVGIFAFLAINKQIETATVTAIIMMVFQNLFNKDKDKDKE